MTERRPWLLAALTLSACQGPTPTPPAPRLHAEDLAPLLQQSTERLTEYLAIDTTNPPGHEARAFPFLAAALADLGLEVHLDPVPEDRGNVWARLAASDPDPQAGPLILLHHLDVVPAEAEHWQTDPFQPEVRDGRLYGRGAIDTKSLGVLQLAALSRLAQARTRLRRDVIWLGVYDEEQGGQGAQRAVETLLPDWQAEYLLDEGGYGVRDMLNGRDILVIAVAQKRAGKLRLSAHGEAGHGSRPIPGGGPNVLLEALDRLRTEPPALHLVPTTIESFARMGQLAGQPKQFVLEHLNAPGALWIMGGTLAANKNLSPQLQDTMSLTLLQAGQKDNVIPAEAEATFDVRLLPDTDADAFLTARQARLEGLPVTLEWIVRPLDGTPAAPTADPLYQALADATQAHEPQAVVSPWLLVGANDSRFFAPLGVKAYGFLPVFLDKAELDTIHGHDENLRVSELERGVVVYAEALERFLLREP